MLNNPSTRKKLPRNKFGDVKTSSESRTSLYNPYTTGGTGTKDGESPIIFHLGKPSGLYSAGKTYANSFEETVYIFAYEGQTALDVYIKMADLVSSTTGFVIAPVDSNGTDITSHPTTPAKGLRISIPADTISDKSGTIQIPIYVNEPVETDGVWVYEGVNQTLIYPWALAFEGGDGEDGDDAINYWIDTNVDNLVYDPNIHSYSNCSEITARGWYREGKKSKVAVSGDLKLLWRREFKDGTTDLNWTLYSTSITPDYTVGYRTVANYAFKIADSEVDYVSKSIAVVDNGTNGSNGIDGIDGTDGVDGTDGTSIVWRGSFSSHPANPENGWAYYNTTDKKSYTYRDNTWYQMTVDGAAGQNGSDGLSIVWKGESTTPPADPQLNWVYRDTNNGYIYIWNGTAWELMTHDGSDGEDGTDGTDGMSVYITYHDNAPDNPPATPTGNGTTNGWHTAPTNACIWMSQKVAASASSGTWGTPIRIGGTTGERGLTGACVRGPVEWDDNINMGDNRRFCNGQHSSSYSEDEKWIDIVYLRSTNKYYRCSTSFTYTAGMTWANVSSNFTQTDSEFKFIATDLLLAQNAKINFLDGQEIRLFDTSGNITAGAKGGNGVSFWAGSDTPTSAPFQVDYKGNIKATSGTFAGYVQMPYTNLSQLTPNYRFTNSTIWGTTEKSLAVVDWRGVVATAADAPTTNLVSGSTTYGRRSDNKILTYYNSAWREDTFVTNNYGIRMYNGYLADSRAYLISDGSSGGYGMGDGGNLIIPEPCAALNGFTYHILAVPNIATKSQGLNHSVSVYTNSLNSVFVNYAYTSHISSASIVAFYGGHIEITCCPIGDAYKWVITLCTGGVDLYNSSGTFISAYSSVAGYSTESGFNCITKIKTDSTIPSSKEGDTLYIKVD